MQVLCIVEVCVPRLAGLVDVQHGWVSVLVTECIVEVRVPRLAGFVDVQHGWD